MATSFPALDDADVGIGKYKEKYNADLANNWGNLVSRVAKLAEGLEIEKSGDLGLDDNFVASLNNFRFDEAAKYVFETYINKANLILNQEKPWTKASDDPDRIKVLTNCISLIHQANNHLIAFMPSVSQKISDCFAVKIKPVEGGLFPRIK